MMLETHKHGYDKRLGYSNKKRKNGAGTVVITVVRQSFLRSRRTVLERGNKINENNFFSSVTSFERFFFRSLETIKNHSVP